MEPALYLVPVYQCLAELWDYLLITALNGQLYTASQQAPRKIILCWQWTESDDRACNSELPFMDCYFVNLRQAAESKPLSWHSNGKSSEATAKTEELVMQGQEFLLWNFVNWSAAVKSAGTITESLLCTDIRDSP
jgi:hypothetical protein